VARFRPFRALRPVAEKASAVASVPYDVVDTAEARALALGNPSSFLHVIRPEIDLPETVDVHDDSVYAKGAENLERLKREVPLIRDELERFFIYQQRMGDHVQTGIVGAMSVDDYDEDHVKKHEKTRKDKEDDRTRHILTQRAHQGPVFLTYRAVADIDAIVAEGMKGSPLYDIKAEDGVIHRVWVAGETDSLLRLFEAVDPTYVADGHHRAKSASRVRGELSKTNPTHDGTEAYNQFLAVLFPSNQLSIMAYNRVVRDLAGRSVDEFLDALGKVVQVEIDQPAVPEQAGQVSMYLSGSWYRLTLRVPPDDTSRADSLDVSRLEAQVLGPLLDIQDVRTDPRIEFIGGIRGPRALEKRVQTLGAAVAFSMFPVTVDDLMQVADAGDIMPPKSTWFEPKLRSGLLIHPF